MKEQVRRILVIGPAWVGDMIMAQSLFMTLKQQYPDAEIEVVAPQWSEALLERMPQVSSSITQILGHGSLGLRARYRLGKQLRMKGYDLAITIPRSFKAALVPFFARIPRRIGYRGEMRYGLLNEIHPLDKSVLTQTVQRYVALGIPEYGLPETVKLPPATPHPQLTVDTKNRQQLISRLGLNTDKPVVGFMPGAEYGPAKQWPAEYFAGLADELHNNGYQVWILGSEKDGVIAGKIQQLAGHEITNLCGKTRLQDVVDLAGLLAVAVTNDSGLMHVAAATGCQIVALYGSSTPTYTPPLTDKAVVMYENLVCSPCFKRECPLGHLQCLKDITVEKVASAIRGVASNAQQTGRDGQ